MSNMSYCRFQNTSGDLGDCVDAMQEQDFYNQLSNDERIACDEMYELCAAFIELYDQAE